MKSRLLAAVMYVAALGIIVFGLPALTGTLTFAAGERLTWRQAEIIKVRGKVHGCQDRLGFRRSPVAQRIVMGGPAYRRWVLLRWRTRLDFCLDVERQLSDPERAIMAVFGSHGREAVRVSYCETGGTFSTTATNGQYLGIFQMGSSERATYGHGSTPLAQAQAAHRYFLASGSDWSPWECKP